MKSIMCDTEPEFDLIWVRESMWLLGLKSDDQIFKYYHITHFGKLALLIFFKSQR